MSKDYERAEIMMEPQVYPETRPNLRKYEVLQRQAKAVGLSDQCYKVPQVTSFEPHVNAAGVQMEASTLSGQDCLGLNDGSKNTTLVTYLTDAWNNGAEM